MEEKDYTPIVPEEEQPEEGFVPYCGSDEALAQERKKQKLYHIIVGVIGAIVVCGFLFLVIGRSFNFYHKTVNTLKFDYRDGETVQPDESLQKGACAEKVSKEIGSRQISADIVMYLMDEKAAMLDGISGYQYQHSPQTDTLSICSGTKSWPFSKKSEIRVPLKDGRAPVTEDYKKPLLYELMFGCNSHDAFFFESYDAYYSVVDGKQYTCEVWLLADAAREKTSYYTLYRYYDGSRLAGLRVLDDSDALMEIYDIRSYHAG